MASRRPRADARGQRRVPSAPVNQARLRVAAVRRVALVDDRLEALPEPSPHPALGRCRDGSRENLGDALLELVPDLALRLVRHGSADVARVEEVNRAVVQYVVPRGRAVGLAVLHEVIDNPDLSRLGGVSLGDERESQLLTLRLIRELEHQAHLARVVLAGLGRQHRERCGDSGRAHVYAVSVLSRYYCLQ